MCIFNYIMACIGISLYRTADPLHFDNMGLAMYSIFRVETLDGWDDMMRINIYGCNIFPSDYAFIDSDDPLACNDPQRSGLVTVCYFALLVIFGGLILPTILIGIIAISFNEASRLNQARVRDTESVRHTENVISQHDPIFFSRERVLLLRRIYDTIDVDGSLELDMSEIEPLLNFICKDELMIDVDVHALLMAMDNDGSASISFSEFLLFLYIVRSGQDKTDGNFSTSMCLPFPLHCLRCSRVDDPTPLRTLTFVRSCSTLLPQQLSSTT